MDAQVQPRPVPDLSAMEEHLTQLMRGVNAKVLENMGKVVKYGPFTGMILPEPEEMTWMDGNWSTKLLGCYEFELVDTLVYALSRGPKVIVNVGCAEGWYAIGLARIMQDVEVIAMDLDEASLELCARMALANGVGHKMTQRIGASAPGELPEGDLYIIDVEGAESKLVDPRLCPHLQWADLIIECHEFLDAQVVTKIYDRLVETHRMEIVKPRFPPYARYDFNISSVIQSLMIVEKRPHPTSWLGCWAYRRGDGNG